MRFVSPAYGQRAALQVFYGAQRFVWEFLKPYPTLIGPFNHFHLMSAGLVIYGATMIARRQRAELIALPPASL